MPTRRLPAGPRRSSARASFVSLVSALLALAGAGGASAADAVESAAPAGPQLDARECFSTRGLDVLVFHNRYDGNFSDAKIAGVELIHHGVRTATNGDVRLAPTPEQWDAAPELKSRTVRREAGAVETRLAYPAENFEYTIRVAAAPGGVTLSVVLDRPLPAALVGRAGLNLEFLPSAYFGKSYGFDGAATGIFPLHPVGPTGRDAAGAPVRLPLATGRTLVLAAEDPARRVTIAAARGGELALFDGRNQAQNGWFVVRTLLPAGATGAVVEWTLRADTIAGWTRPASIAHSQVGYRPAQRKVAVVECDANAAPPEQVRVLRFAPDGAVAEAFVAAAKPWGPWLRYRYFTADFSVVREPGLYALEATGVRTAPFRIAEDVYARAWQPTLDVFLPVQMDHLFVNEAYRVWHGRSHLDDARQAPPNFPHFDLYAMGPETDSPFAPGAHVPGLAVGGWFDAGDFDLRTQTHYDLVQRLVQVWEEFRPARDETTIDQAKRHVELHRPDGVPDLLQQIEHGVLQLVAQHRVFGHAIPGIVEPDLGQYTHLGDAVTKTDGRVDDPARPDSARDDRLAFTTATTALNYGSAAALAAASRALRGYRDALADECLATALRVWEFERGRKPNLYRFGNTTGGDVGDEEIGAALELLVTTKDARFARRLAELEAVWAARFPFNAVEAARAAPLVDAAFAARLRELAGKFRPAFEEDARENPFGVPITRGGWAGNGRVVGHGLAAFFLHRAWPDLFSDEPVWRSLEYLHGCHPDSDISFVSGVGARSKRVAYGSNRADFTFIAGGIVPGVLILKPDFPENKEDWPFFWGENEYVVNLAGSYLFLVHAAAGADRRAAGGAAERK